MAETASKSKSGLIKEFILYALFGVLTTVVSWGSYYLFSNLFSGMNSEVALNLGFTSFHMKLGVVLANVVSIILAMVFAFFTNKVWVFNSKSFAADVLKKEAALFFSTRLATALLEFLLVPILSGLGFDTWVLGFPFLKILHLNHILGQAEGTISKIFASVFVVILNYVFSKLLIFKPKSQTEENK